MEATGAEEDVTSHEGGREGRPSLQGRFTLMEASGHGGHDTFPADVAAGLGQRPRRLPFRYLYDAEGSRLFERITRTPEYYPTRAEREILEAHADRMVAAMPDDARPFDLFELGSGSAVKTRLLIEAALRSQRDLTYRPIDISRSALEESAWSLLGDYPRLTIEGIVGDYAVAAQALRAPRRRPQLIVWLGSSIGNLERDSAAAFLRRLAGALGDADRMLVGFDVCRQREILEHAYDDDGGVTAAFNRNLLVRINRELGGHFDPDAFAYRARWDEAGGRVEMSLVSRRRQAVRIDGLDMRLRFEEGEPIFTERSHKYTVEEIAALAASAGLTVAHRWSDRHATFAAALLARAT